ncbi:hypothetical protein U9M48_025016, partial [Paspalum notatum var. saurae]
MAMPNILAFLFLVPFLLASNSDSAWPNNDAELQALLTIKKDWGNPAALRSWKHSSSNTTASASSTHCKWVGVACNNGRVIALSFQNFNITHPIPASICSLKNLSRLDLSYNNLTNQFPTALYSCLALQYLDLSNNLFSGALPPDINKLSAAMEHLNLSSNGFAGTVPSAIAGFPKLKSLLLDNNGFNGMYPASAIGGLSELETLTLAYNPFVPGLIPDDFGKLMKLKLLWLSGMNLTGSIPDALSSLIELTVLALSDNKLGGEIPAWIWKLQRLEYLYLYANRFTGAIGPESPDNITAVSLQQVDLSSNMLTGPISESVGNMKNLTLLYLYFNNITGEIPASVGLLPNLDDIRLFNNMLSGRLPPELGRHSPLGNLEVSDNRLSGELPATLCYNKKLYDIVVFNNSFSGDFPAVLGACHTVNNIMAYNNRFTGEFPVEVWSTFPALTTVMIQNNSFTGTLPSVISPNITMIQMGNNRFSGSLPAAAPGLKTFTAEKNQFSGGLPTDMSGFASLIDLDLSRNMISGSIPPSVGSLISANSLNLSSNQISGAIPAEIGLLPALAILDLSRNKLAGDIPEELSNLHLVYLNLSSNQLAGDVPDALENPTFYASFLDNPGLCARRADSGLLLQACSQGGGHHSSARMILLLAGIVVPSISVISLVGVIAWRLFLRHKNSLTSWKMIPFDTLNFTEQDIVSNMSEENVIGRGGSGKVYRIRFSSSSRSLKAPVARQGGDAMVAVKKIIGNAAGKPDARNVDKDNKEFEAEVRSLGGLRHGNIVRLLCCISGDDTKLLVYEYMENGSLDRWLHRRGGGGKRMGALDWPTRLRIAVDVARGLSYMHHGFTSPVIHRDVKCSNILLDREFGAKIADFGLARILAKSGESEPVSAVCGTFGYIAPEYVTRVKVSEKVDVYSFGVVLLELATGRGAQDGGTESGSCLAKWASKRYKNGDLCIDLIDGEIQDTAYLDDMVAVFELGVVCTSDDPTSRPPMSEVLHQLLQCGRNQVSIDIDEDSSKSAC